MDIRKAIVDKARGWLGVKFRHQGRSRRGVDCVGLVINVHNEIFDNDVAIYEYETRPNQSQVYSLMNKYLKKITKEEAQEGDVVLMALDAGATHLGIITSKGVIHAFVQSRKVVEKPLESFKVAGYYRMQELA